MTTLRQIELQCPVCENRFRSRAVVSTNSFGGKRTDFHERAAGTQPLPYLVHTCNRCGYTGAERDFTEEAEVTPVLRAYLVGELWRRVGDQKRARAWFDRVPSEVVDARAQGWILEAAGRQREMPREWFP